MEKSNAVVESETPLAKRTNALWMGTHVVDGSGKAVVVSTGKEIEFGKGSDRLNLRLVVATLGLPFTPVARLFDFRPLTISFIILLGGIVALYIIATETSKKLYYGKA